MFTRTILLIGLLGSFCFAKAQLVINEIATNGAVLDAYNEESDWLELYNNSATAIDLNGYALTDDPLFPNKWPLPAIMLDANEHLLLLANGNNTYALIDHWESAVLNETERTYFVGTSEPPSDWNTVGFDDTGWSTGPGGIGFGDGDDNTVIASATSCYMRCAFDVADVSVIENAKLHMDYDDAFVAYLNGVEIARSGNIIGTPPTYNTLANADHEAGMYAGYPAEEWNIPAVVMNILLVPGENILSIQVHNVTAGSSDLSSNAWFSVGINNGLTYFSPVPAWFAEPVVYSETNFKITNTGETIYLFDNTGAIADMVNPGSVAYGHAYARIPDGAASWCTTTTPTPDNSNDGAPCFAGYEPLPVFSLAAGFYTGTQTLTLSSTSPTAQIRYTTDGSLVTATSPVYTGPITISSNEVVAARCYSTGTLLTGEQVKRSYFIDEDDYTLPILSISIDPGSLFDYDTGIYEFGCCYDAAYPYFGANFWQPWERFGHIEYFTADGDFEWGKDMSLEIHGGWSRAEAQRGFRVDFKNKYGGNLEYPLFGGKPDASSINNFNIRSGGQHVWTYKIQDAFLAKVMEDTHIDYEEWQPCMLFINGDAWGLYEIREKADEHFVESNYGINNNDVDLLNSYSVLNGSDTGWWNIYSSLMSLDPLSDIFYDKFNQAFDMQNYIDYYIGEIYYQNVDFGGYYWGANNMKVWRNRYGGKWRFIMYDMDGAMGYFGSSPYDNYINLTRSPAYPSSYSQIFDRVLDNQEIREYFVNRFADLINTIYQPDNMEAVLYEMRDSILSEIPHQVERWGAPNTATVNSYVDGLLSYNNSRKNAARTHINNSFDLDGQRTTTLAVSPAGAGYIKINTIVPTELPWTGIYFDGVPITITAVPNPGYTFDSWLPNALLPGGSTDISLTINMDNSTTFTAVFTGTAVTPEIIVSEINYNSYVDYNMGDWIELHNAGTDAIDISYWKITDRYEGNAYILPAGSVIESDEYLVIAKDPIAFSNVHPDITNVVGGYDFEWDNSGDDIRLFDIAGNEIIHMAYADSLGWPQGADGTGRTLELINPTADMNNPGSWFDGCIAGSPGEAYSPCNDALVFSEINYNSSAAMNAGDWVEILNTTTDDMDISGWKFLDGEDSLIYTFESGTTIPANERLVLSGDLDLFESRHPDITNVTGAFNFGLDASGEEIRLFNDHGILQFTVIYDDAAPWPYEADGAGKTLELESASGIMNNGDNWFAGCPEGSPGTIYDPDCDGVIAIEESVPASLLVFPNPAKNYVMIAFENNYNSGRIELCNLSGQIIYETQSLENGQVIIPRNEIASGVYRVRLIADKKMIESLLVWE